MGSAEYAVANGYLNYPHRMLGMKCLWKARLEETKGWLCSTILVGMMNVKVLDGLAASKHTGEVAEEEKKTKMTSSGLSYLSKYQVSRTIKLL